MRVCGECQIGLMNTILILPCPCSPTQASRSQWVNTWRVSGVADGNISHHIVSVVTLVWLDLLVTRCDKFLWNRCRDV